MSDEKMKVGFVASYSEDDFEIAAKAGLDCIEINTPPDSWFRNTEESWREVEEAKKLSKRYGISISSLIFPREIGGINLRANKTEQKKQLQLMANVLDVCKKIGDDVLYCLTGPQGYNASKTLKENVLTYKEVYTPVANLAAEKKVKIAFENCPGMYPFAEGSTLAITPEVWELMFEVLQSDYIGLEFDPSHLIWQLIDVVAAAQDFKNKIFIVHAKDTKIVPEKLAKVGTHGQNWWIDRHPGYGDTDWQRIIMILHEAGFKGSLVIEHFDTVFGTARRVEGLRISANYLRKFMVV